MPTPVTFPVFSITACLLRTHLRIPQRCCSKWGRSYCLTFPPSRSVLFFYTEHTSSYHREILFLTGSRWAAHFSTFSSGIIKPVLSQSKNFFFKACQVVPIPGSKMNICPRLMSHNSESSGASGHGDVGYMVNCSTLIEGRQGPHCLGQPLIARAGHIRSLIRESHNILAAPRAHGPNCISAAAER